MSDRCSPIDPSGWRSVHERPCRRPVSVPTDDSWDAFECEFRYHPEWAVCRLGRRHVPTCSSKTRSTVGCAPSWINSAETADFADLLAEASALPGDDMAVGDEFVWPRVLSAVERRRVERWMARRHSITVARWP